MAVPDFQTLMLPLLRLAGDDQEHTLAEAVEWLAQEFRLSDDDRTQLLQSGQTRLYNRVAWTTTYLRKAGLLLAVAPGRFQLSDRGRQVLASKPEAIDVAFLESRFPEMSEFRRRSGSGVGQEESPAIFDLAERKWTLRPGVEQGVREKLERSIPTDETRHAALALLAFCIENADEERPDAWYLRETSHGLRLMTGRLLACHPSGSRARRRVPQDPWRPAAHSRGRERRRDPPPAPGRAEQLRGFSHGTRA